MISYLCKARPDFNKKIISDLSVFWYFSRELILFSEKQWKCQNCYKRNSETLLVNEIVYVETAWEINK